MNKIISIIRISILLALAVFAFLFIFGQEQGPAWEIHFFADKALGFGAAYLLFRLYKRWSSCAPWLMAYDAMCRNIDKDNDD